MVVIYGKAKIILELLKSLNTGNTCCAEDRVRLATNQYNELVKSGIVIERQLNPVVVQRSERATYNRLMMVRVHLAGPILLSQWSWCRNRSIPIERLATQKGYFIKN